jgi:2-amino-4-hydroxy-6-hydroxymethyldihydropteridine diphosphokinase
MAPAAVIATIALGSNLGERRTHLAAALTALRETADIRVVAVSPLFETAPVGPPPQGPYLNAAARLETSLSARALLARLHEIEASRGRERGAARDLARSLDLDLLLFGEDELDVPGLVVPHPRLHERAFVLEPLRCIAAEDVHPILGETIDSLASRARESMGPAFEASVRRLEDPTWPSSQ